MRYAGLAWVLGVLTLTALGLFLARRWLDKQDRRDEFRDGPP